MFESRILKLNFIDLKSNKLKNYLHVVEFEVSLPCSKDSATCRYSQPGEPSEHHVESFP